VSLSSFGIEQAVLIGAAHHPPPKISVLEKIPSPISIAAILVYVAGMAAPWESLPVNSAVTEWVGLAFTLIAIVLGAVAFQSPRENRVLRWIALFLPLSLVILGVVSVLVFSARFAISSLLAN
jgi:hypothetical protein